ncbi:hypothetical protein [Maribacter polysaccharolyticus]|uniref:hypothetical protein n=1 Tax=Maribacter polysaccharolyticus TaxID=3020831 RepID=UPI00237EF0E5|nr:hypothetical protein [Maribacter polysaccharolyticus]MDE3742729.1 hypothetical protein [Maribacter polysaccharolyticus]
MRTGLLSICAVFVVYFNSFAQDSITTLPKRVYTTKFLGAIDPPILDGQLNDVGWEHVA